MLLASGGRHRITSSQPRIARPRESGELSAQQHRISHRISRSYVREYLEPDERVDPGLTSTFIRVSDMGKSVCVSETFHEFVKAHKQEGETMEETLRRLIGGPNPEDVAGILSEETATKVRNRLETKQESDVDTKQELRDRFE